MVRGTLLVLAALHISMIWSCGDSNNNSGTTTDLTTLKDQTLFVAHDGSLVSYDLATGNAKPGTVTNVNKPVGLQTLADGTVLVNVTGRNEVLIVDGLTMLEKARLPSSSKGAVRPVHSFITPDRNGKRYWITMNDGKDNKAEFNSALFIDVLPTSPTYLTAVGEVTLGVGHHKASFSNQMERMIVSNIADCGNVLSVYDYSNPADIKTVKTFSAADLGWDGSTRAKTCDTTYATGAPPAPHGCATSKVSNKAYCNLTANGAIAVVDLDATTPTVSLLTTSGKGGGYTRAHGDGRYIFTIQSDPRDAGASHLRLHGANHPANDVSCTIGQLVVVDAVEDKVIKELPLGYEASKCASALKEDEETVSPGHILVSKDGKTLFIGTAGGFGVDTARSRQELVVNIANPTLPEQAYSVAVGASKGHHDDILTSDRGFVAVTNTEDGTVSLISVAEQNVVKTIAVSAMPLGLATFSPTFGTGEQVGTIE